MSSCTIDRISLKAVTASYLFCALFPGSSTGSGTSGYQGIPSARMNDRMDNEYWPSAGIKGSRICKFPKGREVQSRDQHMSAA